MIQLHFDPEPEDSSAPRQTKTITKEDSPSTGSETPVLEWRVVSLRLMTPQGHEIDITTSNPSAVSELLATLTGNLA